MRSFISPLQRRRSYRHEAVNIPQRRSGRFLLLCSRLLPTASSGGILNTNRAVGERLSHIRRAHGKRREPAGECPEEREKSPFGSLAAPTGSFPFQGTIETGFEPAVACYEHAAKPSAIRICCSCLSRHSLSFVRGTLTRGALLFRQVPLSGANGSTKVCWLCLSVENAAQGSRLSPHRGAGAAPAEAKSAGAAFSLNGTRCRFQNSQRVFTPAGQILPDKGSEMLLWASFVYQDASYLIGSRPSGPRIRSFRIVSLIQGEFAVSVFRFRPASPQTRPCNRGVQIGVPAGLKARSLLS